MCHEPGQLRITQWLCDLGQVTLFPFAFVPLWCNESDTAPISGQSSGRSNPGKVLGVVPAAQEASNNVTGAPVTMIIPNLQSMEIHGGASGGP